MEAAKQCVPPKKHQPEKPWITQPTLELIKTKHRLETGPTKKTTRLQEKSLPGLSRRTGRLGLLRPWISTWILGINGLASNNFVRLSSPIFMKKLIRIRKSWFCPTSWGCRRLFGKYAMATCQTRGNFPSYSETKGKRGDQENKLSLSK